MFFLETIKYATKLLTLCAFTSISLEVKLGQFLLVNSRVVDFFWLTKSGDSFTNLDRYHGANQSMEYHEITEAVRVNSIATGDSTITQLSKFAMKNITIKL